MQLGFQTVLALRAIRSNGLRSVLTVLIIAIGIMALVGILTAFEILKTNVTESFGSMGANAFQITSQPVRKKQGGNRRKASKPQTPITYEQVRAFQSRFGYQTQTDITLRTGFSYTIQYGGKKTNPNVTKTGIDEAYLRRTDTRLFAGRAFTEAERSAGKYVCIIGIGIARKLSPTRPQSLLENTVTINNISYTVVGIAAEKGGSLGMNEDNVVLVPLENARLLHGTAQSDYTINVAVKDAKTKEALSQEAEGVMRNIRKTLPGDEADFTLSQNDQMVEMTLQILGYLLGAAVVIAAITLLGSVIGLMNIMLVSVAERTREIGVSKALGARASTIRRQFLLESVLIGFMGGLLGAVLGMGVGNLLGLAFQSGFIFPWGWMGAGILLCIIAGIVSGIYPALKASQLNPITALRYE